MEFKPIDYVVYGMVLATLLYATQYLVGNEITSLISKTEA